MCIRDRHGLDVLVVGLDGRTLVGEGDQFVENDFDLLTWLGRHAGHGCAKLLDLFRAELLQHLGRFIGSQGHQQQGALLPVSYTHLDVYKRQPR